MIFQRFAPIFPFLNRIQSICSSDDDPYFNYQYSLDVADVSSWILNNEKLLESTLDHIENLAIEDKILDYVRSAAPERRFLLYTAIQISYLHFDADKEKVPLIPPEGIYPFVAAYLQEGFTSFKRYCQKEGLLIWDQVIEYELDLMANQNF